MSSSDKTAVIVVNFNGKDFLDHCLSSLSSQTFSNFQTIVVDNASQDGSVKGIEKRFPDIINQAPPPSKIGWRRFFLSIIM